MKTVNKYIWKYVPHSLISVYKLFFHEKSFLHETSFLKTLITNKPTNSKGEPIPWLSYSAIKFLDEKLDESMTVFEYGSGMSTFYLSRRTKETVSVENYKDWFDVVESQLSRNSKIIYQELDDINSYANSIKGDRKYDLIIIDGRERVECCKIATEYLNENGILIFDDGEREKYQEIYPFMQKKEFKHIKFYGLRPASSYFDSTVIFYKKNNVFNI